MNPYWDGWMDRPLMVEQQRINIKRIMKVENYHWTIRVVFKSDGSFSGN